MGLNVSLFKFQNFDDFHKTKVSFQDAGDCLAKEFYSKVATDRYDELNESQQKELDAQMEALCKSYGVDMYGEPLEDSHHSIEEPSDKYPEHMFKIGYWRSSYNDGGFNTVCGNLFGKTLYDIFEEVSVNEFYFRPDWEKALEAAKSFLAEFQARVEEVGDYKVMEIFYNEFKDFSKEEVVNQQTALEAFLEEMERREDTVLGAGWQSRKGRFYPKGISVFGVVEGKASATMHGNKHAQYVVYKPTFEDENEGTYDWYVKATEIVIETIEYVLAQDDPSQYVLGWSG